MPTSCGQWRPRMWVDTVGGEVRCIGRTGWAGVTENLKRIDIVLTWRCRLDAASASAAGEAKGWRLMQWQRTPNNCLRRTTKLRRVNFVAFLLGRKEEAYSSNSIKNRLCRCCVKLAHLRSTTFNETAFSFSGLSAWNALPADNRWKQLKTFYVRHLTYFGLILAYNKSRCSAIIIS